jgi:hypothetical protein
VALDLVWWSILLIWSCMAAAIYGQQRYVSNFQADRHNERAYLFFLATPGSAILAGLDGLVLAYVVYSAYGLLWTLVLCVTGSLLAGILLGVAYALVDEILLTLAAFAVWPASAGCIYLLLGWANE